MKKEYSLQELADITKSKLIGNPDHQIEAVEDLKAAGPSQAAFFLDNPRYEKQLEHTLAGVIFVSPNQKILSKKNYLVHPDPSYAFQKVIELFHQRPSSGFLKVHASAIIHESVQIGKEVTVGPKVVIDQGVKIGDRTTLGAGCYIGANTFIGADCQIYPNVTIRETCLIKDRVVIQPGAVIGSCGFGYHTDKKGSHHYLPQLGSVILEEDVEIGANTTIDRARFKSTVIGKGSKIDNLVQIGHQVEIGRDNLVVSQVGIAGSTKTGSHVVIGGQTGIVGHISICDKTMLAARSGVSKSIEKPGIYSGAPALPIKEFNHQLVHVRNVEKLFKRLKEVENKLSELITNSKNNIDN